MRKSVPAENEESLEGEIDKAHNKDKTEQDLFRSAIGCTVDSAFEDMCRVKEMWHKEKGVQGFHLVQSLPLERFPRNWPIKSGWNLRTGCSAGTFRRWSAPISTPNASITTLYGIPCP